MLGALLRQLSPIRIPLAAADHASIRALAAVERLVMPGLRILDRAA